jgi:hypothetical protein
MIDMEAPYLIDVDGPRRPRIALMGEFSAGKSTLANLMVGSDPLPMQVVATQLPPVWISYGASAPETVDLEGRSAACDLARLKDVDPAQTAYIRVFCEEDLLRHCDIIDMPGISDPNMDSVVWERILPLADAVIWCSAASQAWRQSEAAVWDSIDPAIRAHSLLLLTRADMLLTDRDRAKVIRRVESETEGLFAKVLPISLLQARDAGQDSEMWAQSGAEPFVAEFLHLLECLAEQIGLDATGVRNSTGGSEAREPALVSADQDVPRDSKKGHILPRRPAAKPSRVRPAPPPHPEDMLSYMPKFS